MPPLPTSTDRAILEAQLAALDPFSREPVAMAVTQLRCLLAVAAHDGETITEIAARLDEDVSAVSRTMGLLGKYGRGQRPGFGFVEEGSVDGDRRLKTLHLTRKGLDAVRRMASQLSRR